MHRRLGQRWDLRAFAGADHRSASRFRQWAGRFRPAARTLAIVPPRPGDPAGTASGISLVTTDIDAFHSELRAEGVDVDPEVMRMGDPVPPMFFLRDPDGNQLFVIERL